MTHHISQTEEKTLKEWLKNIRDDRITFPHGVPFEHELLIIEKMLRHDEPEKLHTSGPQHSGGSSTHKK